ncbi:hypothetical protein ABPG72_012580 [Tetrahymena utriculariae]
MARGSLVMLLKSVKQHEKNCSQLKKSKFTSCKLFQIVKFECSDQSASPTTIMNVAEFDAMKNGSKATFCYLTKPTKDWCRAGIYLRLSQQRRQKSQCWKQDLVISLLSLNYERVQLEIKQSKIILTKVQEIWTFLLEHIINETDEQLEESQPEMSRE